MIKLQFRFPLLILVLVTIGSGLQAFADEDSVEKNPIATAKAVTVELFNHGELNPIEMRLRTESNTSLTLTCNDGPFNSYPFSANLEWDINRPGGKSPVHGRTDYPRAFNKVAACLADLRDINRAIGLDKKALNITANQDSIEIRADDGSERFLLRAEP